jgi:CMP-N-acetylneuraminic acid synthetase
MTLSGQALAYFLAYDWPGNVRELRNMVERLVIMTAGDTIGPEDLPVPLRPAELSAPGTPVEAALRHAVETLEADGAYRAQIVVRLEISHPFRENGLIDRVIRTLVEQDLDTVFTAHEDRHNFWKVNADGELEPLTDGGQTRAQRPPIYKEVSGLVCAMRAEVVRKGQRLGDRVGVVALNSLQALVDTQDESGLELARRVL